MAMVASLASAVKAAVAQPWGWRVVGRPPVAGCIVLMYHRIGLPREIFPHLGADEFLRQVEWLAANCHVIGPGDLRRAVRHRLSARPSVLITFDDGYRDYHDTAYPILKRFSLPAVVFLATDYVDHPRLLWWDRLHLAVEHASVRSASYPWQAGSRVALDSRGRAEFARACKQHLKSVDDEAKDLLLAELERSLGAPPSAFETGRQIMNWDEVRATMDLTTYGGHTHTHPLMSKIDDRRLAREIRLCRERITAETGIRPTLFAYPNGDVTGEAKSLLAAQGFEVAFSTTEGFNDATTDWLEVRRVPAGTTVPTTAWMMANSWR